MANALLNFFVFFLGPLAYVVLATGKGTRDGLEILNLRVAKRSALYFLAGALAALAFSYGLDYLIVFLQDLFGFQLGENVIAIAQVQGMSIPLAFLMAALTALGEELFFRGFLQNRGGILFTSVIFTLSHIVYSSIYEIVAAVLFSLIMGYAVKRTKDLGFAVGMHFTNNFFVAIIVNYFPHLAGI
jgi:membrane protease YdiL (CAAX protease family)